LKITKLNEGFLSILKGMIPIRSLGHYLLNKIAKLKFERNNRSNMPKLKARAINYEAPRLSKIEL
jgi:hypothetical protein